MEPKKLDFTDMHGAVRVFICVLALVGFSGCASANYQKADDASDSLRKTAIQINAENRAIDVTLASLDNLVNRPAPDLKPQFKDFSKSVDRLAASATRSEKTAEGANRKGPEYF